MVSTPKMHGGYYFIAEMPVCFSCGFTPCFRQRPAKGPLKILAIQIVFVFQIVPHILHIVVIVGFAHKKMFLFTNLRITSRFFKYAVPGTTFMCFMYIIKEITLKIITEHSKKRKI